MLVQAAREFLEAIAWRWTFAGEFAGTIQPLYHPGTLLVGALLLSALVRRTPAPVVWSALGQALRRLAPVTSALVAMLGLARVMVHAGMIEQPAITAAATAGGTWPLFAPFVGLLGTFVTGSATASNILFADFQQATAQQLDLPILPIIGAQGTGAAVGNAIAPHNIIAGGATVGLSGQEGAILRQTFWFAILYAALGGVLALVLAAMWRM